MPVRIKNPINISYYIALASTLTSFIFFTSEIYHILTIFKIPEIYILSTELFLTLLPIGMSLFIIFSNDDFEQRYKQERVKGAFNVISVFIFGIVLFIIGGQLYPKFSKH